MPPPSLELHLVTLFFLTVFGWQVHGIVREGRVWFGPRTTYYRDSPIFFLLSAALIMACFLVIAAGACLILYVDYLIWLGPGPPPAAGVD